MILFLSIIVALLFIAPIIKIFESEIIKYRDRTIDSLKKDKSDIRNKKIDKLFE